MSLVEFLLMLATDLEKRGQYEDDPVTYVRNSALSVEDQDLLLTPGVADQLNDRIAQEDRADQVRVLAIPPVMYQIRPAE